MKKRLTNFIHKHSIGILLLGVAVLGLYFRLYNVTWDEGYYFHPDERAIVMFTTPIAVPNSIEEFFQVNSPLNTKFFAYGNFPLYLLKIVSVGASIFNPALKEYSEISRVARPLATLIDAGTIILVFLIGKKLFSPIAGLFGSLLYALSVFPIQVSHFYTVDPILSFLICAELFVLLLLLERITIRKILLGGAILGLLLATKTSGLIIGLPICIVFNILLLSRKLHWGKLLLLAVLFVLVSFITFAIAQPYALIDFKNFIEQNRQQSLMSSDPFTFPYTLQYVYKTPYLYDLKNISLWGQGPLVFLICVGGLATGIYSLFKRNKRKSSIALIISFTIFYLLVFGSFAVGWMRYMLPLYPLLSVFGGLFLMLLLKKLSKKPFLFNKTQLKIAVALFVLILLVYPLAHQSIYANKSTRITATEWIHANIPPGSTIAIEHWDDAVPINNRFNFNEVTLPLYDPDTPQKWEQINQTLAKTDYIILASNRLYVPLQKLTDCQNLPPGRCYKETTQYYKDLFAQKRGFHKYAEFTSYPTIPFIDVEIKDDDADESFTVYDHPKIMIYKKD